MSKLTISLLGLIGSGFLALPATAQIDNTQILPDAKPGECYAKVLTPAKFTTRSEEIIIQEASERIEAIEARYETVNETIAMRDAAQKITAIDPVFEKESEQFEIRPAEVSWTTTVGEQRIPASPDAIEHIARSGIDLESVAPGSCFVEYFTEAQFETETHRVLVKEAVETISVEPAEYETVEEQMIIKEASSEVVDVPAVYRTETESVLVEPARSVWQEDCGIMEQVENATGEVLCLVEIPARYETLTKTVLDTPASTKTINIPAVYKTFEVQRLVRPASEKRVNVPAQYTTVNKRIKVSDPVFFWLAKGEEPDDTAVSTGREICLTERPAEFANVEREVVVEPASSVTEVIPVSYESVPVEKLVSGATERRILIPARSRTVTTRVETAPAKVEWRKVLCQANMTTKIITSLQRALKREGYDPGPIDGIVGKGTMDAIESYQTQEGIDKGGITYEVLQRLKVQS